MRVKEKKYTITQVKLEKILDAQREKKDIYYKEREQKIKERHEEELKDIYSRHSQQIEKLHNKYTRQIDVIHSSHLDELNELRTKHSKGIKSLSIRRLDKYKKIVEKKNDLIESLEKENIELKLKLRKYKEAYNIFRPYRDGVISIAQEMGTTSDKIMLTVGKLHAFFDKLRDLADIQEAKSRKLDPKVEQKLLFDKTDNDQLNLRLIEKAEIAIEEGEVV